MTFIVYLVVGLGGAVIMVERLKCLDRLSRLQVISHLDWTCSLYVERQVDVQGGGKPTNRSMERWTLFLDGRLEERVDA